MFHPPQTTRLRLRRYTPDDAEELFDVFADPDAREFYPQMVDPARVRAWIEWNLRNYQEHGFGLWAVELKSSGMLIGDCGLTYQEVEGAQELEIGYHIHQAQRRLGYALEAARACLDFGFRHSSSDSICSIVRPSNAASRAVASRLHVDCREYLSNAAPALLFYTGRHQWENRSARR